MSFLYNNQNTEQPSENMIREVYAENFESEMKKICKLIETYNYVALDTEFPGFPNIGKGQTQREIYYNSIKANVDSLKLIQVGITLCDQNGNYPKETASWQFNFKFDLKQDQSSIESIELLKRSGINFDKLSKFGMKMEKFGEMLISSGLILNEDIKWISFHGAYDFAYLLKVITNQPLPDKESSFLDLMEMYFPFYYDVRYLVKNNFRGSLSKLAQEFDIMRIGSQHQAGSDSVLTAEIYFKIKKQNLCDLKGKNVLFGLGQGSEEIENSKFNNSLTDNNNFPNTVNSFQGMYNYEVNPFYGYLYPNNMNRGFNNAFSNYNYSGNSGYNLQNYGNNMNAINEITQKINK